MTRQLWHCTPTPDNLANPALPPIPAATPDTPSTVMGVPVPKPVDSSGQLTRACIKCAKRKTRCDRQIPCGSCSKSGLECAFPPPKPPGKQKCARNDKKVSSLGESSMRGQGATPNQGPATQQPRQTGGPGHAGASGQIPAPASVTSESERSSTSTQLVHGQGWSKLVDK